MRKIFLLLFIISSVFGFSQTPPGYTKISAKYDWIAGKFDSTFTIPFGTSPSIRSGYNHAGAIFYNTTDTSLYGYTGTQWIKIGGDNNIPPPSGYGVVTPGIITWLHDLVYNVSPATYWINGVLYNSPSTDITLAPADVTDNRIDVVVGTTSGTVTVVQGVPDNPAVKPQIETSTQFEFGFIVVFANTTEPPSVTEELIYDEGVGSTVEWDTASSTPKWRFNGTSPYSGSKNIQGALLTNGDNITLTNNTTIDLSSYNALVFQIKSVSSWPSNRRLVFTWYNGTTQVGTSVIFGQGAYGFNSTNSLNYQTIAIPLSDFGNPTTVTKLNIRASMPTGSISGMSMDHIILQATSIPGPSVAIDSGYFRPNQTSTGNTTHDANYHNFLVNNINHSEYTAGTNGNYSSIYQDSTVINFYALHNATSTSSQITLRPDSIAMLPFHGILNIDSLQNGASTDSVLVWSNDNHRVGKRAASAFVSSTPGIDDVLAVGQALTANRTIDNNTSKLTITTNSQTNPTIRVNNTDNSGNAGWCIYAVNGGQPTIFAQNTIDAVTISALSEGGTTSSFVSRGASTNAIIKVLNLETQTTGTAAAGIGASIQFAIENGGGAIVNNIEMGSTLTTVTNGSETSQFYFNGLSGGSSQTWLTIGQSGYLKVRPMTVTEAGALTPAEGMIVFVSNTDATFTSIGLWDYENGAWHKL